MSLLNECTRPQRMPPCECGSKNNITEPSLRRPGMEAEQSQKSSLCFGPFTFGHSAAGGGGSKRKCDDVLAHIRPCRACCLATLLGVNICGRRVCARTYLTTIREKGERAICHLGLAVGEHAHIYQHLFTIGPSRGESMCVLLARRELVASHCKQHSHLTFSASNSGPPRCKKRF